MPQYKGAARNAEISPQRRRKDTRLLGRKLRELFESGDGVVLGLFMLPVIGLLLLKVPFSGEVLWLLAWLYKRRFINVKGRGFDFPYRVPIHAHAGDGSYARQMNQKTGRLEWKGAAGITHLGQDLENREQVYSSDSDLRTHMLVLGTTGSGKTEFLLGLVFNVLVQNTGCIYVDGKGDPKLQKEIFRLARYLGREDDLLIINFITSGRDFVEKQLDKVTNTMNMMSNTSSGMLIELIVSAMDDAGGGGDMWKGRAISFVASLTRPLVFLRDKGYINLSPEKYLEYFELNVIEELVWEHHGKYGEIFDVIVAPLRSYLITLPGYQKSKLKKQDQKTLEQHGFIVMQLTRIFNDLTFNYGHIFKCKVGDVDFFDVVMNRRLLVVLLPALERAPDSLRMLGKLIVGSIKQMMAGCLGNRVEGMVREIIESRPTNANVPFYTILDEYGYYAVLGFAVAPAQARSLGFAVIFAAQDFSSLKKSSAEEADATWENTNVRAVGRLTSGEESETWRRVQGAAGQASQAVISGFERTMGAVNESFRVHDNVQIERSSRLEYDDLAMQENGEFTLLIGKKERGGQTGGVRVIRGMGFYTAGPAPKEMRINDLIPVEAPEPADLPQHRKAVDALLKGLAEGSFPEMVKRCTKPDATLITLHQLFERNYSEKERPKLARPDAALAVLGAFLGGTPAAVAPASRSGVDPGRTSQLRPTVPSVVAGAPSALVAMRGPALTASGPGPAPVPATTVAIGELSVQQIVAERALAAVCSIVQNMPKGSASSYTSAVPVVDESDTEIRIDARDVTDLIQVTTGDAAAFKEKALPILRSCLLMLDEVQDPQSAYEEIGVADPSKLMDAELTARGKPFETLQEKYQIEDRIRAVQQAIGQATEYPAQPPPEPRSLQQMRLTLSQIAQRCQQEVKSALRESSGVV
jgi:intracellular multiplication protein IcmO